MRTWPTSAMRSSVRRFGTYGQPRRPLAMRFVWQLAAPQPHTAAAIGASFARRGTTAPWRRRVMHIRIGGLSQRYSDGPAGDVRAGRSRGRSRLVRASTGWRAREARGGWAMSSTMRHAAAPVVMACLRMEKMALVRVRLRVRLRVRRWWVLMRRAGCFRKERRRHRSSAESGAGSSAVAR